MEEPDQQHAAWLADLQAKDKAVQDLRLHVRQQDQTIADLRTSSERRTALSESLSEQLDRLSDRCDELSQLEQQQRQETETQRRLLAELQHQYRTALHEADQARKGARAVQQLAAELQIQLSEAQTDEALQARVAELESRLVASVPEGTGGLDTLREQLGRMERRMDVARSVGFVVAPGDASAETEDYDLQLELQQALHQQSELQERLRGALLCDSRTMAAGDAEVSDQNSPATHLQLQLEHEKKERAAAEALVAKLQQMDDERVERERESAAKASKLAEDAEAARDVAIRQLAAMQRDRQERDRGQIAEQRRSRRELMQVTQQLEEARAELVTVRARGAPLAGEGSRLPPPPDSTGNPAQPTDIFQPDDGAGPELLHKVSRRDVRQLRLERDRALRECRRLVDEHEITKAQLATTTTQAIEREQQRTAELEIQLADLAEQLADAKQRAASGMSEREHEAQLVAENLGSEVARLKGELTRAKERAEKSDARLVQSQQKSREDTERMRESYEDEMGALEAQLTGASPQTAGVGAEVWRKRAEVAEETTSKLEEELAMLRTENAKLSELVRQGARASEDAAQQPEPTPADATSSTALGPEESRVMGGREPREEVSLAVQKELEEIAEDLMRQVESLLDENHKLRAKIEQKRARAKEKKRSSKQTHDSDGDGEHGHAASIGKGNLGLDSSWSGGGLGQSTPQRGPPIAAVVGRPGATPAAQPQSHSGRLLGREALSPQRMQSLLYGSNDLGGSPNTRALSRAAVKTRRPAAAAMFDRPEDTSGTAASAGSGVGGRGISVDASVVSQSLPLPTERIAGLPAEQARALAAARAAVLAPSPPGAANSSSTGPIRNADSKPAARERRRLEILKLAQAIHGGAGGASGR